MGITRKFLSVSTLGLIDWRSDKERIARSTRRTDKGIRAQNKLIAQQTLEARHAAPAQSLPPAGWMPDAQDPRLLRWWDGSKWTEHTQARTA
jgi:hypothetical protein